MKTNGVEIDEGYEHEKEVCRQIKSSGKRSLIWSRQNGFHYITNRHWLIRFADDQLPREVLIVLFSIFAMIPDAGKTIVANFGEVSANKLVNIKKIYSQSENASPGKITQFSKEFDKNIRMRIVQSGSEILFLNEDYTRMVDSDEVASCNGRLAPVFFLDGSIVILPYRITNDSSDQAFLAELVGL